MSPLTWGYLSCRDWATLQLWNCATWLPSCMVVSSLDRLVGCSFIFLFTPGELSFENQFLNLFIHILRYNFSNIPSSQNGAHDPSLHLQKDHFKNCTYCEAWLENRFSTTRASVQQSFFRKKNPKLKCFMVEQKRQWDRDGIKNKTENSIIQFSVVISWYKL